MAKRGLRRSRLWYTWRHCLLSSGEPFIMQYAIRNGRIGVRGLCVDSGRVVGELWADNVQFWDLPSGRRDDLMSSIFDRMKSAAGDGMKRSATPNQRMRNRFPNLCDLLSVTQTPDGRRRQVSKITVSWAEGAFKASLNDFDLSASCIVSGDDLEGLLEALEAKLAGEDVEWRFWPQEQKETPKRGRK